MLIMPPLQKFSFMLSTVNTNFSGLTEEENREKYYFKTEAAVFGNPDKR